MVYVCFSYRNNLRSLYYSEYEYFDSSTKLPEMLLLWDVTLPVMVHYNCAPADSELINFCEESCELSRFPRFQKGR